MLDRESLAKLKEQAESEKADHIRRLDEAEKTIAQANQLRAELIGRANQAVGAIAALDKAMEQCDASPGPDEKMKLVG